MRTLIPICAALVLHSCQLGFDKGKVGTSSGDNSPIIIADGTVHLKQARNFRVHGPMNASVKETGHKPQLLGYQCSANPVFDPAACTQGDCATKLQAGCTLDLKTAKSWTFNVSDSASILLATLSWPGISEDNHKADAERIDVYFPQKFTVMGTLGLVDLQPPTTYHLGSVVATVDGKQYPFPCNPDGNACVVIGYYCPSGCPPQY